MVRMQSQVLSVWCSCTPHSSWNLVSVFESLLCKLGNSLGQHGAVFSHLQSEKLGGATL